MQNDTLGFYGKLPVSSEFLRWNASSAEIEELDRWIREGMYYAKTSLSSSWPMDFAQTDPWNFLFVPREGLRFIVGALIPSQDKAGREFPFLIYHLLGKLEYSPALWCAPLRFRRFFTQCHDAIKEIANASDISKVEDRVRSLGWSAMPDDESGEKLYRALLLGKESRELWASLFGDFEHPDKYRLFAEVIECLDAFRQGGGPETSYSVKVPLLPSCREETYDLPFWVDLITRAAGKEREVRMLLWSRRPSKGKPLLLVAMGLPSPHLMLLLVHPERIEEQSCVPAPRGSAGDACHPTTLNVEGRALLDDGNLSLEAFLNRSTVLGMSHQA